jgi:flagellar biosynthetic protein FlhB
MADSDAERTEPASQKRLDQAREDGDVPRSRELATFTVLMAAGAGLWMFSESIIGQLRRTMVAGLTLDREQVYNADVLIHRVAADIGQVMLTCLPVAGVIMLVALASPMLIGGWLFSTKVFTPNFGKLNPLQGLLNMVSSHALVELAKALIKTVVVGAVAYAVIRSQKQEWLGLANETLDGGSAHMLHLMGVAFMVMTGALGAIALVDGPYQMWHYANKLKMTRQEMIQEHKESEGNPQIKAKVKQMQREMARRRMMADVPTADVVVTNPSHYSVALKYAEGKMGAPVVVAKGADEVAFKIRELAKEHNVAVLEAPPLARALYTHAEIGDQIPEALYTAVAEVLAYVFQLRAFRKGDAQRPDVPKQIEVPATLDPLNPAAIAAANAPRTLQ